MTKHRPWPYRALGALAATLVVLLATINPVAASSPSLPAPTIADVGRAGIAPPLPPTASRYTASGTGPYAGLHVTVNQTDHLINQAISVTWSGGTPTASNFSGNYLQMMQCWSSPSASGPTPQQCEFGGAPYKASGVYSAVALGGNFSYVYTRQIPNTDPGDIVSTDYHATCGSGWWVPFDAVDGTVVPASTNGFDSSCGSNFSLNRLFDHNDTNELDFASTQPDGTGSEFFTVDTALEAPGLGCGGTTEPGARGSMVTPKCWLVVVPQSNQALTSPLAPSLWKNRIVIPLSFSPVSSSCALGAKEVPIQGGELASPAVTNWQPALCAQAGSSPYNYSVVSEDQARQDLLLPGTSGAGMAVVSRPVDSTAVSPSAPVTYAPLTLSAVVVAFNVQRNPWPVGLRSSDPATVAENRLTNTRIEHLNLTPRLVAKLLTQSYEDQFLFLQKSAPPKGYDWVVNNPDTLFNDPDFEQYNPEFLPQAGLPGAGLLQSEGSGAAAGGLVVEEPNADAANALWQWVLSDRQARAWLDGTPDLWGMRVNPYYSTSAALNPSGVPFGNPSPDNFPKSDPYCWQDTTDIVGQPPGPPRPLCDQDWFPYAGSMQAAAQETLAANDKSTTTFNGSAPSADQAWSADGPQPYGNELVMSITDSASAAQYGLQTASLSPSGEDGSNPTFSSPTPNFVAPDAPGISAGETAMTDTAVPGVLQPTVTSSARGAYPLPMLTYAAVTPATLDRTAKANYAKFITYAVGPGQTPGVTFGDLPVGYVPLPKALVAQADAAAKAILASPTGEASPISPESSAFPSQSANSAAIGGFGNGPGSGSLSPGAAGAQGTSSTSTGPGGATGSGRTGPGSGTGPGTGKVSLAAVPTPSVVVGLIRYVIVAMLALGVAAAFGALDDPATVPATHPQAAIMSGRKVPARLAPNSPAKVHWMGVIVGMLMMSVAIVGGTGGGLVPKAAAAVVRLNAQIAASDGTTGLASGGSATPFTIKLPPRAACPGDSEHDNFFVDTYAVPVASDPGKVSFPGGFPSVGTDLVEPDSTPYTGQLTAVGSGEIVDLPVFSWGPYAGHPQILPLGSYNVGVMCVDRGGHDSTYWNAVVTFAASHTDPGGFTWTAANVPAPRSGSGLPLGLLVVILIVVATAGVALWVWLRRRDAAPSAAV